MFFCDNFMPEQYIFAFHFVLQSQYLSLFVVDPQKEECMRPIRHSKGLCHLWGVEFLDAKFPRDKVAFPMHPMGHLFMFKMTFWWELANGHPNLWPMPLLRCSKLHLAPHHGILPTLKLVIQRNPHPPEFPILEWINSLKNKRGNNWLEGSSTFHFVSPTLIFICAIWPFWQ